MNLPNKITVFRFCCIPFMFATAVIDFKYHWITTFIIYLIACFSDKLDGVIARKHNLITDFGKLMDPLSDKALTFSAFLILVNMGWHTEIVIAIMLAREFLVAGMRMAATVEGEVIAANMFGKLKTLLQMVTIGACFFFLALLEFTQKKEFSPADAPNWIQIVATVGFWLDAVVTALSGLIYTKDGWHFIKTK